MRFTLPSILVCAAGLTLGQETADPAALAHRDSTPEEKEAAYRNHVLKVLDGVRYREGIQDLPGGIAQLHLPEGYRYLDPEDARKVVVDLWGNPPGGATEILGLVVPEGEHLAVSDSWAIVLSYSEVGHVSDDNAGETDYTDLLAQLKEGSRQSNQARRASGFDTMDLTGWAVAPHYDPGQKVLYWAKRFKVAAGEDDTLNYEVRVLGRRGVFSLNGISGMSRVTEIEAASPAIVSMLRFNEGSRYSDFDPATDKKANYSLAGLILGGPVPPQVAAKASAFEKSGAFLILGLLILAVLLKKVIGSARTAARLRRTPVSGESPLFTGRTSAFNSPAHPPCPDLPFSSPALSPPRPKPFRITKS